MGKWIAHSLNNVSVYDLNLAGQDYITFYKKEKKDFIINIRNGKLIYFTTK